MAIRTSAKHLQIDKTQSVLVIVIVVATILTIFCLMSSKALLGQATYQRKVLHARREAVKQLKTNIANANQLIGHYSGVFEGSDPANIIGGKNTASANAVPPDGTNTRIILDALPIHYDFPALITSVSGILSRDGLGSPSISASDQSASIDSQAAANPQPTSISLSVSGVGRYQNIRNLVKDFERSIRPFDITNMQLAGNESQMTVTLTMNTYFQPAKSFNVGSKVVK